MSLENLQNLLVTIAVFCFAVIMAILCLFYPRKVQQFYLKDPRWLERDPLADPFGFNKRIKEDSYIVELRCMGIGFLAMAILIAYFVSPYSSRHQTQKPPRAEVTTQPQ